MNFEFFIANRIAKSKTATKKVTRPVIKISMWAIAIGIIIMIVAIATGNGLRKEIRGKVIGFGGDIQILNYQPNPTHDQAAASMSDSLINTIAKLPEVNHIQGVAQKAGILKTDDLFEGVVLKGLGSDFDWSHIQGYIKEGNTLRFDSNGYNDSILISETIAKRLEIDLNERVAMYFVRESPKPPLLRRFYVAGIFKTDFDEVDNNFILGDLKHIQRLNSWDSTDVGGYEVYLSEDASPQVHKTIRALVPYHLDALTSRELNEQLFQWLDLFDININTIIIILIAVATINMSIALLILILERTQLVGILKALGSTNGSVIKIFLINASYLILKGLFWGNFIGIGLCLLQQQFGLIKLDPSTYYVSQVSIDLNWIMILGLNAITMVVCLICLVIPSLLITRISPVKAIRFD